MSPDFGEVHQAAVRLPPAPPTDTQRMVGPVTRTCPSALRPVSLPTSRTRALRASSALADGQGWLDRHVPSASLAATPDRRMRGPSSHHTGPSPSHTRRGVHSKLCPAGTIRTAARRRLIASSVPGTDASDYSHPTPSLSRSRWDA